MPDKALSVALIQLTSIDNPSQNEREIFNKLDELSDRGGARLIVFPENALFMRLSGNSRIVAHSMTDPIFTRLENYCRDHQCEILLTTPIVEEMASSSPQARVCNATVWVSGNRSPELVYKKIHLFDVDIPGAPSVRESSEFEGGSQPRILDIDGWKIGLSICYDVRFSELFLYYAKESVDIILVPSAFLVPTGRAHWEVLLRARAIECQSYILAPGQGGVHKNEVTEDTRETWGHSLIVDPWGTVLAQLDKEDSSSKSEKIIRADLDPAKIVDFRRRMPMSLHRRI